MAYNYYENLKRFLQQKDITNCIAVMIKRLHILVKKDDSLNPHVLLARYCKNMDTIEYCEFFNHLCTWDQQIEGIDFWEKLHREWKTIAVNESELSSVLQNCKSIW